MSEYKPYSSENGSLLMRAMETRDGYTENNCVTNTTTSMPTVDFFFQIGGCRGKEQKYLTKIFSEAFSFNALDALKLLFWSRDVRGGLGERKIFRDVLSHMSNSSSYSDVIDENISLVPVYGRWDDLFVFFDTPHEKKALDVIKMGLNAEDALCAKWMPREKSSKQAFARLIRNHMGISPKAYRSLLSKLTNVVETQMCSQEWDNISYDKLPSIAVKNYRKAFERNSPKTWLSYMKALQEGSKSVNASTLFPHDLVYDVIEGENSSINEKTLLNTQWNSLPNYILNNTKRMLPVVDTSGSMYSGYGQDKLAPIYISIALGLYIAERNEGPFKDYFMTFSKHPTLQKVQGTDLFEKVGNLKAAEWGYNTDIQAVFDKILDTALQWNLSPEDLPTTVLVLSDMEFDQAMNPSDTAYKSIQKAWFNAGLLPHMPEVVFWNLNSRSSNFPVKFDDKGTALVSGFSPTILKQLLREGDMTPQGIMRGVIDSERYKPISLGE